MKYLANSTKANLIDRLTTEEYGIASVVLMERASLAVADVITSDCENYKMPNDKAVKVFVLSGLGNNGGDAIAAGRILHERGFDVSMYIADDESKLAANPAAQFETAAKSGVRYVYDMELDDYDIIIDGLFGVGLNRNIEGLYADMIATVNRSGKRVYSVDIPSGIDASTGNVFGCAVKAYKTITFGLMKTGLMLYPGAEYAGETVVCDIGFPSRVVETAEIDEYYSDHSDLMLLPERKPLSNKGTYGKVLVVAGSPGMCGAAYMAAKAAYRSGCGLVRILSCEENIPILQGSLPEAIISGYDDIDRCIKWADAIAVGPGTGMSDEAKNILKTVLLSAECNIVIDADAINLIASDDEIRELYEKVSSKVIVTPHLKEMTRLAGVSIEDIRTDMPGFAKKYTKPDTGVVLVLKDARTIVSDGYRICINSTGNDGMATGGSGDVLTGIIASYLAQGADRFTSAVCGVYAHGLAGDKAAGRLNRHAVMAGDIIESLGAISYTD